MRTLLRAALALAALVFLVVGIGSGERTMAADPLETPKTPGELVIVGKEGKSAGACPLKHTDVSAQISGFIARVDVVQEFHNPTDEKIEAIYTFPLPNDSAVDYMEMKVGQRTIVGEIHRREQAREIYEAAKEAGHVASLLDQERPNIFTQAVANIMPGEQVTVKISYTQLLKYEGGEYEFVFPMVVGPRYIPGNPVGNQGTGREDDTDQVPDASKITPPITPEGTRAGHDISLRVELNAVVPVQSLVCKLHEAEYEFPDPASAIVTLKNKRTIPNKDFVLNYSVAGEMVQSGIIAYAPGAGSGFFTLIVQPPKTVRPKFVTPKEMIFILDTSGSQQGEPIKKSKETMFHCIKNLNPGDTFNLIAFSNQPRMLFENARPYNAANEAKALEYVKNCEAKGGTEIIPALQPALASPPDPNRLRVVVVFTDGYVGNDFAILDYLQKNLAAARVFTFGIGNSVNRFLLERMAEIGRGAPDFVLLSSDGKKIAEKFYGRIRNPLLTDITVDWNGLPVVAEDVYPKRIPDLFGAQPLVLKGCYASPAVGEVIVRGKVAGEPWAQNVAVEFPAHQADNDSLASIWARAKIDDLMAQDWMGAQTGNADPQVKEAIVDLALDYHLMTQYTSFVAVEKMVVTTGGEPKTIAVPVEMPEGVSYEGIFGDQASSAHLGLIHALFAPARGSVAAGTSLAAPATPAASKSATSVPAELRRTPVSADLDNSIIKGDDDAAAQLKERVKVNETAEKQKQALLNRRLSKDFRDLLEAYKKSGGSGSYPIPSGLVVKDGRVEAMIWVKDFDAEKLKKLEELGLKDHAWALQDRILIGWIPLDKLEEFALLDFVVKVCAPTYSGNR